MDKYHLFTSDQQSAFEKYRSGNNVFITGPGGSGKSMFIKALVEDAKNSERELHVCALTGCAAILLECGAKTLHSWGGFGLAKGNNNIIAGSIADNKYKKRNWRKVQTLVVDEVSMLSYKMLDLMELTARKARKNNDLFGGIQVILCGDFFQLPPVGDTEDQFSKQFCFESPLFDKIFSKENKIQFSKIFRQSDPVYSKILNKIRIGKISQTCLDKLKERVGKIYQGDNNIKPTIIHPLRGPVDRINKQSLDALSGEGKTFKLTQERCDPNIFEIHNKFSDLQVDFELKNLENNINCQKLITLKKGAQVMSTVNIDLDNKEYPICNGSQGIIIDFQEESGYPIVRFNNGIIRTIKPHAWQSENIPFVSISQIPLILAWAVTIHKVQGATIDLAEIDIGSGIFEYGQSYVALSRVTSLDGLYLKSFDPSKIKINLKVQKFYENIALI
jgi:ATP-dependent DNA helicase PIF1